MKRQKQVSDLESNNVLSIDLTDVMFSQQTVAGSRAILDQWGDFTRLVDKANVAWAVFVHGDGALKGPGDTHTHTQRINVQAWGFGMNNCYAPVCMCINNYDQEFIHYSSLTFLLYYIYLFNINLL